MENSPSPAPRVSGAGLQDKRPQSMQSDEVIESPADVLKRLGANSKAVSALRDAGVELECPKHPLCALANEADMTILSQPDYLQTHATKLQVSKSKAPWQQLPSPVHSIADGPSDFTENMSKYFAEDFDLDAYQRQQAKKEILKQPYSTRTTPRSPKQSSIKSSAAAATASRNDVEPLLPDHFPEQVPQKQAQTSNSDYTDIVDKLTKEAHARKHSISSSQYSRSNETDIIGKLLNNPVESIALIDRVLREPRDKYHSARSSHATQSDDTDIYTKLKLLREALNREPSVCSSHRNRSESIDLIGKLLKQGHNKKHTLDSSRDKESDSVNETNKFLQNSSGKDHDTGSSQSSKSDHTDLIGKLLKDSQNRLRSAGSSHLSLLNSNSSRPTSSTNTSESHCSRAKQHKNSDKEFAHHKGIPAEAESEQQHQQGQSSRPSQSYQRPSVEDATGSDHSRKSSPTPRERPLMRILESYDEELLNLDLAKEIAKDEAEGRVLSEPLRLEDSFRTCLRKNRRQAEKEAKSEREATAKKKATAREEATAKKVPVGHEELGATVVHHDTRSSTPDYLKHAAPTMLPLTQSILDQVQDLQKQVESYKSELDTLRKDNEGLRGDLEEQKKRFQNESEDLQEELEEQKRSSQKEKEDLQKEIRGLRKENKSLQKASESIQEENKDLQKENKALRREKKDLQREQEGLREKTRERTGRELVLERENKKLKAELASMKCSMGEMEQAKQQMKDLEELNERLGDALMWEWGKQEVGPRMKADGTWGMGYRYKYVKKGQK